MKSKKRLTLWPVCSNNLLAYRRRINMKKVPLVDVRYYTSGTLKEQKEFIDVFGKALQEFGFVVVEGHGIETNVIKNAYQQVETFFNLSDEVKSHYIDKTGFGQRGFITFGSENAKNSSLKDLKEFWHVGREYFENDNMKNLYPKNVWPSEVVPKFKESLLKLYSSLDIFSSVLLSGISEYLNLPKNTLPNMAKDGNTILRALHYPPLSADQFQTGAVRAAAHEDINLITILCEATESGLQILTRDGKWLDVESSSGQMVVDTGDMLARMTNDVLPSTTHRVVNPANSKNTTRYSMPFFVHAYGDCELSVFDNCVSPSSPIKYSPILADEFLKQRLHEIGFGKTN